MTSDSIPLVERRKLTRSGTAVVLRVPQDWMKENGLNEGDEVIMVANVDLTFKKMTKENVEKIRNQLAHHSQTSSEATDIGKPAGS